jgi:acetoin:2,6-dichlorophenolindophenol oxidoreductase subunit alpha
MKLPRKTLVGLYREMLRIRQVELRIESLYHLDEMKTPVHLCIGQEAVAVGVCSALHADDYISSNHRGHGHYLAKGGDLKNMIAELYCRSTGCSKGRGGSMHLVDRSAGHLGSSSIVGGGIPIATGLGLAIQMRREDRVSAVFFGDGAADEGVLYESVNFAVLKRLPVVYICENNQYSVCSRVSARQRGQNIFHQARPELLATATVDGNSVEAVHEASRKAVDAARRGAGPSFIECTTYRMRGHAGSGPDTDRGYRTPEEVAEWEAKCPVRRLGEDLLQEGWLSGAEQERMLRGIESEIDEAFEFAQSSPLPGKDDVLRHLFVESA